MRDVIRRTAVVVGSLAVVLSSAVGVGAVGASAQAGPAASGQQCRNGPITDIRPCQSPQSGGVGWVRGNAGGSNAHWAEGDFISYRILLTGLTAGDHSVVFAYHTIRGSKHAIDYIGNYDETETTGAPTHVHANRNNPCQPLLGTGPGSGCTPLGTPPIPASRFPVPDAALGAQKTACGASGLPETPTQVPGDFSLFAPDAAHAKITGASYVSQNVMTGGGQCTTTMRVDFSDAGPAPSRGWSEVLAFGGRIASALDWGDANAAGSITGSPYHMMTRELDGTTQGSQDLSLSASAVAAAPTPIDTAVSATVITAGRTLTDTATLTGRAVAGPPTGRVQFQLCSGTTTGCPQGTGVNIGSPVNLSAINGTNNSSATSAPFGADLAPGNYCVGLEYMNDDLSFYSSTYVGAATNECFTVVPDTEAGPPVVFAGYTDGFRTVADDHPSPWEGSNHVIFVGCNHVIPGTACSTGPSGPIYDAGALMLINTTGHEITVTDASVTAGGCHFTAQWQGLKEHVPVDDSLILTQTGGPPQCPGTGGKQAQNFDTSEVNHMPGTAKCDVNDGVHPIFHVSVDGDMLAYNDIEQTLNTGGVDPGAVLCGSHNETEAWDQMPTP